MAFYKHNDVPEEIQRTLEQSRDQGTKTHDERRKERTGQHALNNKKRWYKRKLTWIIAGILLIIGIALFFFIRTGMLLGNISTSDKSLFKQLVGMVTDGDLKGMNEGRINVVVFGMRGKDENGQPLPGGSTLTDTNMIISYKPDTKQVAMISVPRDLYIEIPEHNYYAKINSAYSIGEEETKDGGLPFAKEVMEEISGLPIHYAIAVDFYAFQEIIDALGGIEITLDKPFSEPTQFEGENETNFSLPAGKQTIDGETALFYSRARYASSDFDRAKRQQQVLEAIKEKSLQTGVANNPSMLRKFLKAMEGNIKTDMTLAEMEAFMRILQETPNNEVINIVFDTSEKGLLTSSHNDAGSYILTPVGGSFKKIHGVCTDVFAEQ